MEGRYGFVKILIALSVLAFLTPQEISKYHFISDIILDLKISKSSPPLAILEDEKIPFLQTELESTSPSTEKLIPQKNTKRLQEIAKNFRESQSIKQKPQSVEIRTLSGMKLDKKSPNIALIKKTLGHIVEPQAQFANKIAKAIEVKSAIQPNLSWQQKARLEAAEGIEEELYDIHSGTEESFEDYAMRVIAQEQSSPKQVAPANFRKQLEQDIKDESETEKVLFSFPSWMVGAKPQPTPPPAAEETPSPAPEKSKKIVQNNKPPKPTPDSNPLATENPNPTPTLVASRENLYRKSLSQAYISGSLEMTNGLALTGSEQILVYHQVGGTPVGYGNVMLEQGKYEIFVENPRTGILVAEVVREDEVLGRTELLLPELLMKNTNTGALKSVNLLIQPIYDRVVARASSAYDPLKNLPVQEVRVHDALPLKKRGDQFVGMLRESTLISKTQADGSWGSLKFGTSKQAYNHTLYADTTIKALYEISDKRYSKNISGNIVGKIKVYGKEVEGATIEVLNADLDKPVYFNSFLPDANLNATSKSGTFAYVGVDPGAYILRAKYQGKYLSSQTVTVERGFVTEVEFDVQEPRLAEAFVFDLRDSQFKPAEIGFLGSEKLVRTKTGRQLVSLSGSEGIQILQAQADDDSYHNVRLTIDKSQKEILLPLIHQDWMSELLTRTKLNIIPGAGVIVGLSHAGEFAVELDPAAFNDETHILYFDKNGQVGLPHTVEGGGVIIVNVNPGLRGAMLKDKNGQVLKVHTMLVDTSAVNVFSFNR